MITTAPRSAFLPGLVRTAPISQQPARIRMAEIDEQVVPFKRQLAPKKKILEDLRAEYDKLWKTCRKKSGDSDNWMPSTESNARMAEICADITAIHREIQSAVENIQVLDDEYTRLQNEILGKN